MMTSKNSSLLFISIFFFLYLSALKAQIGPKRDGVFRIAVLGCHRQFEPAPALVKYLETDPDLCIWVGDNVYADTKDDPSFLEKCYQALEQKPAFQELRKNYDFMATWDDHDFGYNDAGKEYPLKAFSKDLFRRFWRLEDQIPAEQDGIYYARTFSVEDKQLQIIMLDVRYNRNAPNSNGDVLGEQQWKWLGEQLKAEADLRIIVSGFQILLPKEAGSETWDFFPDARRRLFELIRRQQLEKVFFFTGDQHYGEVCRRPNLMDFDAVELQFSGINQIEEPEFNPFRVSPVITSKHSYTVMDIQMNPNEYDPPHVLFHIADAMRDRTELTYRFNLEEISLNLEFPEDTVFGDRMMVELKHNYPELSVRYTLDGQEPGASSALYSEPIMIEESCTFKARFFTKDNQARSRTYRQFFEKLSPLAAQEVQVSTLSNGLSYRYFEGHFTDLPDFSMMEPTKSGVATAFDPELIAEKDDHYAIWFDGMVKIEKAGLYDFFTISDDGSRLLINDRLIVDNGGSHSKRMKKGLVFLEEGYHRIRVEYFEDYSGQSLEAGYFDPEKKRTLLSFDKQLFYKK